MGDFSGSQQVYALIDRLRSELVKTILEGTAPRVFDDTWQPTSGGYGLALTAAFDVGSATNPGGGLVGIPATAHGFVAGEYVEIHGTANYDRAHPYRLDASTTANLLVIPATYAAETFSATDLAARPGIPEHWGAGRITSTLDPLCPILEAWRWAELDSSSVLEDPEAFGGLTWADIAGETSEAEAENLRGAGYMLIEQDGGDLDPEYDYHGAGSAERCEIRVTIRVPFGYGQGQAQLYSALLARVLRDRVIGLGSSDALQFGWVPEMGRIEEESGEWLGMVWRAEATRFYF